PDAVCAGTLNVLAAAGETAPLLLLVDDLQWVDPPSQRVLLFVARRLAEERVGLVVTAREDCGDQAAYNELPRVDLAGLSSAESEGLLRQRGMLAGVQVVDELVRLTAGNPLALLEAAASLRPAQLTGQE